MPVVRHTITRLFSLFYMKCSCSICNEYISRYDLILAAIIMVHWTFSININNHNKIVYVHKYHLGRETLICHVTKITISQNTRIYYENKNARKHINSWWTCYWSLHMIEIINTETHCGIYIYIRYKFCQVNRTLYIKYTRN